jgi:DNA-binding transcriptional LysR family regulator
MGVLWAPRYMAEPHVKKGELTPLFEEWQLAPMPLYLAYPQNRHLSARLRVFIAWVEELARQSL